MRLEARGICHICHMVNQALITIVEPSARSLGDS